MKYKIYPAIRREALPQTILTLLPFLLFLPTGSMFAGLLLFLLAVLISGDYRTKWINIKENPLFWPILGLSAVTCVAAIFLDRPTHKFWSGFAHYQTYLLLLLFISVGKGDWQRRAITVFFMGALFAATLFYLNQFNVLPAAPPFTSYVIYGGNKSILLGILLAIAAGLMLYEITVEADRRWLLLRVLAFLYVVIALLFFAKTRTGHLVFVLLSLLVLLRYFTVSWRSVFWLSSFVLIMTLAWHSAPDLRARVMGTAKDIKAFSQGNHISGDGIRLEIFRITSQLIVEKPITGHGIATWSPLYKNRAQGLPIEIMTTPHNDYLLYSVEIGLVGLAALLWIWLTQLIVAWKMGGDHGMWLGMLGVTLVVGGMFNSILRDAVFGLAFMVLLAIPLAGVTRKGG